MVIPSRTARRRLLAIAALLPLTTGVFGQEPARTRSPRVIFVAPLSLAGKDRIRGLFAERGWKDGANLSLEFINLFGGPAEERERGAREAVASRPDAFVGPGDAAAPTLTRLTGSIPIVFYNYGASPVRDGLVESLRRPGRNVTGTTQLLTELTPKMWELVKEFRPDAKRAGEVYCTVEGGDERYRPQVREQHAIAARALALSIVEIAVPLRSSLEDACAAVERSRVEIMQVDDSVYRAPWMGGLLKFLERRAIPNAHPFARPVRESGGLLSLTPDFSEGERQAVAIVDRILKGESPATIPVYEVTRYHIAVNARTARAMRLQVPPSILARASEIIS